MGAWGTGAFDNDVACDWAGHLKKSADLKLVRAAIGAVLKREAASLKNDIGTEAIAACEVLARLKGKWGTCDAYSSTADQWVRRHAVTPDDDDLRAAIAALDRVTEPGSELAESWVDAKSTARWRAAIAELRGRLADASREPRSRRRQIA